MEAHFSLLDYILPQLKPVDIKEEFSEPSYSLISPPVTPSPPSYPLPSATTASRRRSSTSAAGANRRVRPYSITDRHSTLRTTNDAQDMASSSTFGQQWPGSRPGHTRLHSNPNPRRIERDESQYGLPAQFINDSYLTNMAESTPRPISSSSSLTGAMGETGLVSQARNSRSPDANHLYSTNPSNHGLSWNTNDSVSLDLGNPSYPVMTGTSGLAFQDMAPQHMGMVGLPDYSNNRQVSPDSPGSHASGGSAPYNVSMTQSQSGSLSYSGNLPTSFPQPVTSTAEEEIRRLQRRVRELEAENSRTKAALMNRKASSSPRNAPRSPTFLAGWKARTDARKRIFCSLNRAGNALCAWHDSRRERRAYPPRNAPPGYLNCGCTHEQALFEESLSRHGVGSYLPGESVRMDPALRNPLLQLLESRYGYKDGDFDYDPVSENWKEGESPMTWEQKAQSGAVVRRRPDPDRH